MCGNHACDDSVQRHASHNGVRLEANVRQGDVWMHSGKCGLSESSLAKTAFRTSERNRRTSSRGRHRAYDRDALSGCGDVASRFADRRAREMHGRAALPDR